VVAELLRLRLRLVANLFRGARREVAVRVGGLLVAIVLVVLAFAGIRMLHGSGAQFTERSIVGLGGTASLAALLVPIIAARRELMPARGFVGYRVPRYVLVPVLAVLTLIGPAALALAVALAPLGVWRGPDAALAVGCGLLLLAQTLLSLRIGTAIGAALRSRRRLGRWVRVVALVLMIAAIVPGVAVILTRAFLLVPDRIAPAVRVALSVIRPIDSSPAIDAMAGSPLGALWAAPGYRLLGQGDRAGGAILIGVGTIVVLAALWTLVVALQQRATWPRPRVAVARHAPGWFGRTPSTPLGAITARSFTYWARDPRYRTVVATLPAIPVLMLLAMWVGGVPFPVAVLVPLPVMVVVLAWSTSHNDVAYDHTALWQHLAASTHGVHDRIGRMWPPLVFGALLVLVGAPLTAWGYGDWTILPAVVGVNLAVLLGSVGVSSGLSAQLPYPAPRPGDGAFRHPQVPQSSAGTAQALSLLFVLLTAAPALAAAGLWFAGVHGGWNWLSLLAGVVFGAAALVLGILGGGRGFDRRGPELLAFTMRN
jgi:ABC-2 type transport system permease protein